MQNKMTKNEVERCLYKCITEKMTGSAESLPELRGHFQIVSGESMTDYADEVDEILNNLRDERILSIENRPNGMWYICQGLNFDQWETKMNPKTNSFAIGSLHAETVQVGNDNTLNAGISADEFIKLLTLFSAKSEPERKSILEQLSSAAKTGASLAETFVKVLTLVGT